MKKAFLILLLSSSICFSQKQGTKEYKLGFGYLGTNYLYHSLGQFKFAPDNRVTHNKITTPAINASFKYAVVDNLFLNTDAVYQLLKLSKSEGNIVVTNSTSTFYTFGIGPEYHYYNAEQTQVYSGISIAHTIFKKGTNGHMKTENYSNIHINLLGLRIGNKLAGTVELGFGYKGILNFGISYQP